MLPQVTDILQVYGSILGDLPYPTFTLAVVDAELPGGHSPPYFVMLNQPLPTTPFMWRNDPVYFDSFPQFFLAHEVAHQFWGQAVGWKNYHEQWISEGFAQYFAALYAERRKGPSVFRDILRTMTKSAIDQSPQGPIWLGYRLGHIKGDSRVFRSLVYNKGAMVLHMLRRLVGDEAFFAGLRDFYGEFRFRKAGVGDVRLAFERAADRSLERFFDQWIHGSAVPRLTFRYQVTALAQGPGQEVRLIFEQAGEAFEVPVTVTLVYASGQQQQVVVPVAGAATERRLPLAGPLRRVDVNDDGAAVARIDRR
jgi:aminopeptidase N